MHGVQKNAHPPDERIFCSLPLPAADIISSLLLTDNSNLRIYIRNY